jgi:hypothetical protein
VRHVGGWLFDQVMAGWDVTVLTADDRDHRPLRILGARTADLETALSSPARGLGPWPQAIAVRADLAGSDERVRQIVLAALDGSLAEVMLWGGECPADLGGRAGQSWHRLSAAARAFKAQALAAAAAVPMPEPGEATEVFRRSEVRRPNLVPVR